MTASTDMTTRAAAVAARLDMLRAERAAALAELAADGSGDTADRATNVDAHVRFAALEQRIAAIEAELLNAPVQRDAAVGVQVGDVVTVDFGDGPEAFLFGSIDMAADDLDVISPASPLGAAIAGAQAGDTVSYRIKGRALTAQVIAIS